MGAVYRARDLRLGRDVALKIFRATPDSDGAARLRSEASMLAGFGHPNLVAAFDAGLLPDDAGAWLALELMSGPNVAAMLREQGRLSADEVRRLLRDVADALAYIHARGIVHRDVKPANVLLTADPSDTTAWHAKLADFGIARIVDGASMTTTGTVIGTAAYFSPEQTRGDHVGIASDIYSLGLVAIEALTGRRAFPGSSVESATARLVRPPAIPDWIGGHWRGLLEAMTASDPRQRPSAAQIERACTMRMPDLPVAPQPFMAVIEPSDERTERVTAVHPVHVVDVRPRPRSSMRRRIVAFAAGGALVVGGVTAAGALVGAAPAPEPRHVAVAPSPAVTATPTPKATATAKPVAKAVAAKAPVAVSTPSPSAVSRWAKLAEQIAKRQHAAWAAQQAAAQQAQAAWNTNHSGNGNGNGNGHGSGNGHGHGGHG